MCTLAHEDVACVIKHWQHQLTFTLKAYKQIYQILTEPWTDPGAGVCMCFRYQEYQHNVTSHPIDDLAAIRRMTDSSSVNRLLASDSAAVRRESCVLQSASTCNQTVALQLFEMLLHSIHYTQTLKAKSTDKL